VSLSRLISRSDAVSVPYVVDSVDVMLDSGQGGVREALAVDNPERKGASALSISYRVAYKMIKVYLTLLRGYLVVDKAELDKL
jgi:hypothetical protein